MGYGGGREGGSQGAGQRTTKDKAQDGKIFGLDYD